MWWNEEKPITVRRRRKNPKRRRKKEPILLVKARKAEQHKEWRHRMGSIVMVTVILVGVIWLSMMGVQALGKILFTENKQFQIEKLVFETDANGKLKESHIREYAGLSEGINLFAVDIDKIRMALESVPLVNTVEVRRDLPGTLIVRVTERTPLARLGRRASSFPLAVDAEGYVLGPSSYSTSLPVINGLQERGLKPGSQLTKPEVRDALDVLDTCDTTRLGQLLKVQVIEVGRPEYLDMRLVGGERILLGREKLDWRLRQVAAILQTSGEDGRRIAVIDGTGENIFPVQYQ